MRTLKLCGGAHVAILSSMLVSAPMAAVWADEPLAPDNIVVYSAGLGEYHYTAPAQRDGIFQVSVPQQYLADAIKSVRVTADEPVRVQLNFTPQAESFSGYSALQGVEAEIDTRRRRYYGTVLGMVHDGEPRLLLKEGDQVHLLPPAEIIAIGGDALRHIRDDHSAVMLEVQLAKADGSPYRKAARLSAVLPAPQWQASYHLHLPSEGNAVLSGYAVLENASGQDWQDVPVTLVYGQPQVMRQRLDISQYTVFPEWPDNSMPRPVPMMSKQMHARGGMAADTMMAEMAPAFHAPVAEATVDHQGFYARYAVQQPVTLAAGEAQRLTFYQQELSAQQVVLVDSFDAPAQQAIWFADDDAAMQPLLPDGVMSISDGDTFVGDVPFTRDAAATRQQVWPFAKAAQIKTQITRRDGTLTLEAASGDGADVVILKTTRLQQYTLNASYSDAVTPPPILLSIPRQGSYRLHDQAEADAVRELPDAWQILFNWPEESKTFARTVSLAATDVQQLTTDSSGLRRLAVLLENVDIPARQQQAWQEVQALLAEYGALQEAQVQYRQQREIIEQEQTRLRENLRAVSGNDVLMREYAKKLSASERAIEELRDRRKVHDRQVEELGRQIRAQLTAIAQ